MSTSRAVGRVFISHSHRDHELVRDIVRRLGDAGFEALVDEDDNALLDVASLEASDRVRARKDRLRQCFREADAVLVLVTPAALDSSWTMTELGLAEALDRLVIPVTAGMESRALPAPLQDYIVVPYDQLDRAMGELGGRLAATSKE